MSITKSDPSNSPKSILKSGSIISVGTLSSRFLGFLRDVILAQLLGTGFKADAFFVALRIPNLLRNIIGEGAANSAVVPVLAEYREKEKQELWTVISVVLTVALMVLSVCTIIGIIAAPIIVRAIAPGFVSVPSKLILTIDLTQFMFPYLVMIGLTAYCMGILYTFRSFAIPAFSPCLLNISIITAAFVSGRFLAEPVFGLAIGVLVGGFLQLVVQLGAIARVGVRLKIPRTLHHPGAAKMLKLFIPRLFGSAVYQLNIFVDTFCASLSVIVGMGGISAIYYANRIIFLPIGVFGLALASAVLPSLSALAARREHAEFSETLGFSLETILFIMVPVSALILVLAEPIITVLFQRGAFTQYSTMITTSALSGYVVGLIGFGVLKVLVAAFHALQDTRTPVKVAAVCLFINIVLNILFIKPLKVGGIALASSISVSINCLVLLAILDKRTGGIPGIGVSFLIKTSVASAAAAVWARFVYWCIPIGVSIIRLCSAGILGIAVYILLCLLLRVEHTRTILRLVLTPKRIKENI